CASGCSSSGPPSRTATRSCTGSSRRHPPAAPPGASSRAPAAVPARPSRSSSASERRERGPGRRPGPLSRARDREVNHRGPEPERFWASVIQSWCCLLTAGELGPRCGERLVAGERPATGGGTGRVAGLGVVAGVVRPSGGLGVGLLGGRDLLAVRLEAGLRLGVLLLPLLALGVEALAPFAGVGVGALGVEVVALGVVGGGHAVGGRVELLLVSDDALVGLLEGQRDAAAVQVDVDDLDQ